MIQYQAPAVHQQDEEYEIRTEKRTDYSTVTLLFQRPGQSGLEIEKSDRSWAPVAVFPTGIEHDPYPPVVLNVGDLLNYWSNGLLKSGVHRVKVSRDRTEESIVYFLFPLAATEIVPIPSIMKAHPGQGPLMLGDAEKVVTA